MHVKKGDLVRVISGNDRGRTGEVVHSYPREGRVLVEGVNMRWRHRRPSQQNPKGERMQREVPIHASNVSLVEGEAARGKKGEAARGKKGEAARGKKGEAARSKPKGRQRGAAARAQGEES